MTNRFQTIIDNFIHWGESSDKLYAALIIGSQAREDHPADEYSDLDLIMIVDDLADFLSSDQWLKDISNFHVSFIEDSIANGKERRVLFDNALDVDFLILTKDLINGLTKGDSINILERGYRIIIDKMGLHDIITQSKAIRQSCHLLTEQDFINIANDFWYHSVWTAKKIKRGEVWTAKYCIDSYMKWKLLSMIECHAHAIHGSNHDTWHNGRFIEEWAESWIIEKLSLCFSHYDKEDIKVALLSTMDLFRTITIEIAEKLNFQYPKAADEYTTTWVMTEL